MLLNYNSYEDVVIQATNMGGDSDTIAAIGGGLKALQYCILITYRNKLIEKDLLYFIGALIYFTRKQKHKNYPHMTISS